MKIIKLVLLSITLFILLPRDASAHKTADTIVLEWNKAMVQAMGIIDQTSFRAMMLIHTSMYNAWTAFDSKAISTQKNTFSRQPSSKRTLANKKEAISYAAYYALKAQIPTQQSLFDKIMESHGYDISTPLPTDPKTAAGIGTLAAMELLQKFENDRSNAQGNLNPSGVPYSEPILLKGYVPYVPVNTVDKLNDINFWQPQRLPDGSSQVFSTPQWGLLPPFALSSGDQFRPKVGPKTTKNYAGFLAQAQQIYDISVALTEKQQFIANFWNGLDGLNPNPFNIIAQKVSKRDHLSLDDDIKMFFVVANALHDANIAGWDAKRHWNSVRPITVIHELIDPNFQPIFITPPHPDYLASHGVSIAAVAEVLKLFKGSDYYGGSFTDSTTGMSLSWNTFTDAATEAGLSRMYAGIHFEDAILIGKEMGKKVAKAVWKKAKHLFKG